MPRNWDPFVIFTIPLLEESVISAFFSLKAMLFQELDYISSGNFGRKFGHLPFVIAKSVCHYKLGIFASVVH